MPKGSWTKQLQLLLKAKKSNNFKIIFILSVLIFASNYANGQLYVADDKYKIGLKAGLSACSMYGNAFTTPKFTKGFTLGIYYRQKFKNGFHFQTELTPAIRGARYNNNSDTGYQKINLLYLDFNQIVLKDLSKNNHTHCVLAGIQPSVLLQSWVYNAYYQLSPAARDIALKGMDVFAVLGYQLNKKTFGFQTMFKIGLTNINRGLNMHDHEKRRLGPTVDNGKIRNFSWEFSIAF